VEAAAIAAVRDGGFEAFKSGLATAAGPFDQQRRAQLTVEE
jgi:hypothetical protein